MSKQKKQKQYSPNMSKMLLIYKQYFFYYKTFYYASYTHLLYILLMLNVNCLKPEDNVEINLNLLVNYLKK